jgi:hypothetical protein
MSSQSYHLVIIIVLQDGLQLAGVTVALTHDIALYFSLSTGSGELTWVSFYGLVCVTQRLNTAICM